MKRTLLYSKIHRATVTDADLAYDGSITIDRNLLAAADIREFESVDIYNLRNGARLRTYTMAGPAGQGEICINGAAAHLVGPGDLVIICCYAELEEAEIPAHVPRVVLVDENNVPREH
ncbi:aspartate 1-decarboxylase [Lignipirellula cremea]|uniref:Aspartate 1-decarboxylase n=1 Tax=Lignipirellula cremea TaxID=2528010 RepID=A0A518DZ88_9BACT|nr:aspartate 1-decarboxylase [Lignipirellula cremea]QDU97144.1 Aspartate 1-decarboxylase precursor [Lignipirellula cremea]